MKKIRMATNLVTLFAPLFVLAQENQADSAILEKIKWECMQHSGVMDIAFHLTDLNGPRVTNSAGFFRAADYAKTTLQGWGLTPVRLDPFGEFGRGWNLKRSYVAITAPYYKPLMALPRVWTAGTQGQKTAALLLIKAKDIAALSAYKGRLAGKVLILDNYTELINPTEVTAERLTSDELHQLDAEMPSPKRSGPPSPAILKRLEEAAQTPLPQTVQSTLLEMAGREHAVALLNYHANAKNGVLMVGGGNGYRATVPLSIPDIMIPADDYRTILRLLKAASPVNMELDIQTETTSTDLQGYNVIADIEGSDKNLKEEVVMLGAHLDSWHGATGATDNAAGVAIVMEAARVLKTLPVHPLRTIRIALWGGEEQGALGSRGYVRKTFANNDYTAFLPAYKKLFAYFNVDIGSGLIRGISLFGNEAVRPVFREWLKPFNEIGAKTLSHAQASPSDQFSFLRIGLPAFQFIQDPLNYFNGTHHSTLDSYDHLLADDLKKSAMIVAYIIYQSAMRPGKLPAD